MFSFFKKDKISINSISIPDLGWTKVKEDNAIVQWINPGQTIAVSVNFFDLVPDIPTIKDMNVLRAFYRNMIAGVEGGVIEIELGSRQKFDIIRTVFKIPQSPSGMTYIGSLTIPFSTCSYVLKVQAVEAGPTGMREAIVGNKFLQDISFDLSSWSFDPYDKDLKVGALMNRSETRDYDRDFPQHPLSQVRALLDQLENNFQWQPAIEKLRPFDR